MFGISKQAYYKRIKRQQQKQNDTQIILNEVKQIRKMLPRYGTIKTLAHIKPNLNKQNVSVGRDRLFTLLRVNNLLIRPTKRFHITTQSKHMFRASENLLEKVKIKHAEQAFVTDITYIKIEHNHAYLALVTDAYSRKIMGWSFDTNMKVQMVKEALSMATKNRQFSHQTVIHHSDRGIQYCCPDYTDFAQKLNYKMSTTQNSDPYENAIAERINGILKYEFGLIRTLPNIETARKMIQQAVDIYNNVRIHWSLNLKTPSEVHKQFNRIKSISYKNQKNNS